MTLSVSFAVVDIVGSIPIIIKLKEQGMKSLIIDFWGKCSETYSKNLAFIMIQIMTGVTRKVAKFTKAKVYGLAVSKNLSDGDIGAAALVPSYFYSDQKAKKKPPFKSDLRFDGKVWEYLEETDLFWNTIWKSYFMI